MNFLEKVKRIFFKHKAKFLTEKTDTIRTVWLIKQEQDSDTQLDILKNNYKNFSSSELAEIIVNLPLNKRTEAIEIVQKYLTTYDLVDISLKKLDYKGKLYILEKFQYRLDLEDIFLLFNMLPPDQRQYALKKCIDRLDSFGISEIIKKYIPLSERLDCLNTYCNKLDSSSKASIISTLDSERKIKALCQYGKELNKTDLNDIVCETDQNKISEVFNVAYNNLSMQQIADIIQYHIPPKQKLSALYKCCDKLNSAVISDLIKFSIPENQKEEALISLQNRIQSNNIGEIIQFCIKGKNILDKVKNNLYPEDFEYFSNKKEQ